MFYLCWHVEGEDEGEGEEEGVGEDEHGGVHLKPLPLLKLTATRTGATPDTAALRLEAEGGGWHQRDPPHSRARPHFCREHTFSQWTHCWHSCSG